MSTSLIHNTLSAFESYGNSIKQDLIYKQDNNSWRLKEDFIATKKPSFWVYLWRTIFGSSEIGEIEIKNEVKQHIKIIQHESLELTPNDADLIKNAILGLSFLYLKCFELSQKKINQKDLLITTSNEIFMAISKLENVIYNQTANRPTCQALLKISNEIYFKTTKL